MANNNPETSWLSHVGLAIKTLRELRKLSQSDLARLSGVGKSQLSKYESGRELPKLDSLARILFALRSSPSTLFYVVDFLNHMNLEEVKRQPLFDLPIGPLLSDTAHEAFSSMLAGLFGLFQAKADLRLLEARRRTPKGRKHDR